MLLGRRPQSHLDLLHPDISPKVTQRQELQKEAHDQHAKYRKFQNGDLVYARNIHGSPTWVPGVVTAMSGPVSMVIQLEDGQAVHRHTDHVKARSTTPEPQVPKKTKQCSRMKSLTFQTFRRRLQQEMRKDHPWLTSQYL